MDLARAPQTAGGPAHDLVDFRPVRREPSLPQHPFLDPRHGDDTGAGSIRGTARVRVRQGVRRREEDQVRGRHRGPDGFRRLLAVRRAGADLEQCRVRPESLRRGEERLPDDAQVDNFATMAATLLGALEVIYSTMKASAPTHVTVESEGGILAVREVTGKMFFVAMSEKRSPALVRAIDDVITKSKALLT